MHKPRFHSDSVEQQKQVGLIRETRLWETGVNFLGFRSKMKIIELSISFLFVKAVFLNLFVVTKPKTLSKKFAEPKMASKKLAEPEFLLALPLSDFLGIICFTLLY